MPEFFSTTEVIWTGRELGRGGEGTVYEIADKPELVAKIYHEPIDDDKAEKLRQMVSLQTEKLLKLAAWTTDVLRDKPAGKIVGFLMPRLNSGTAIHELYNPKSRRQHFPEADWRFLVAAAANLARAFSVIHAHNHAVGDVNHGNIVIARDATVKLIDCDSYHLNAPDRSFLCEVGVSTHTPPELQNHTLRDLERTPNHDGFGLAVIIFQLLFMGRHPFSGAFLGDPDEDNTLERSIAARRFAYGDGAKARLMRQPPGTLPLAAVSTRLAELFERAFLEIENRPAAREWIDALDEFAENLSECKTNAAHYFYQDLKKCPWCALEGQTGVLFFPARWTGEFGADGDFDVVTLGRLIDSLKPPPLSKNLPATTQNLLAPAAAGQMPPSTALQERLTGHNQTLAAFLVVLGIVICWVGYGFGAASIIYIGFACYWLCWAVIKSLTRAAEEVVQLRLDDARQKWSKFKDDWQNVSSAKSFEDARLEVKAAINQYRELPQARQARLKEYEENRRQSHLQIYLRKFAVKKSDIEGLGDARLQKLLAAGVKTAAEISDQNLKNIENVGGQIKGRLKAWRANLEKNFVFSNSSDLVRSDAEKVETEFATLRLTLETKLKRSFPSLQQFAARLTKQHHDLAAQSEPLAAKLSQAENDYKLIANLRNTAIAWSIGVAVMSFGAGVTIRQAMISADPPPVARNSPPPAPKRTITMSGASSVGINPEELPQLPNPGSNLGWGNAGQYYQYGEYFYQNRNYKDSLDSFQVAASLKPEISLIHKRLGDVLVELNRYDEAVKSYKKAVSLNPQDGDTFASLGHVQWLLKRQDEAIAAFKKAVAVNPTDAPTVVEMARIMRETGNSRGAIPYLEKVIQLKGDNQARFQLGLCHLALGDKAAARKQYQILQHADSGLAIDLLEYISGNYDFEDVPPPNVVTVPMKTQRE